MAATRKASSLEKLKKELAKAKKVKRLRDAEYKEAVAAERAAKANAVTHLPAVPHDSKRLPKPTASEIGLVNKPVRKSKVVATRSISVETLEALVSKYDNAVVIIRRAATDCLQTMPNQSSVYLNDRAPKPVSSLRGLQARLAVFGLQPHHYVVVSFSTSSVPTLK